MTHSHHIMAAVIAGASLVYLFNWLTGISIGWSWVGICVSAVFAEMIFGDKVGK
jgi:hypothetical protein